ncbi:glycosyltransferase involved in cell wall biosynthesis [Neomicrococcus aestuarii]|uniref:D-inositol 3-phosphate glycosyltransferase n=1 Tax=Neomicrococcus aestuarii TaxID=556325 RepID=A0A7W8WZB1_9MICC|nr:glycosyltransferase [Neomicrococcus aestuarii]MBB5512135.1 glycosyltransferase involved in cell wall biosynthesis [Neomicrococcus aestuarii]
MSTKSLAGLVNSLAHENFESLQNPNLVESFVDGVAVGGASTSGVSLAEKSARLRLASAIAEDDQFPEFADLATSLKDYREATRLISRVRLDSLPSDTRSAFEKTRKLAQRKPGTNNFGLSTNVHWLVVEPQGQPSVLSRFMNESAHQDHASVKFRSSATSSDRESLLDAALKQVEVQPNTVVITQVDGQTESDALWLAGALGLPSLLLDVVANPRSTYAVSPDRLTDAVGSSLWKLFPSTLVSVEDAGRRVSATDLVSGKHFRQSFTDFPAALRHFGAAAVVGRDLEIYAQSNPDFPQTSRPIADWIRRDIKRTQEPLNLCATILERLWHSPRGFRARLAAAQLESYVCENPHSELGPVLESARFHQHRQFEDQIRLRRLFQANYFEEVQRLATEPLDLNSTWIRDESVASIELLERLHASKTVAQNAAKPAGDGSSSPVVCVLHASSPQQSGGYAIRAHGIFKALKRQGEDVYPVTRPGFPEDARTLDADLPVPPADTLDEITYHRLAPVVPRELGEAQYMRACIERYKEVLVEANASALHVRSTFLIAVPAIIAARELGLRTVYEVSGLWELVYEAREREGALNGRTNFATFFEKTAVDFADLVITMNYSMMDVLESRGGDRSKMRLAPNAVDISQFQSTTTPASDSGNPADSAAAVSAATDSVGTDPAVPEKTTLGYIGSVVDYEGLEDLAAAVALLKERRDDFSVVIVGDGLALPSLQQAIKRFGVKDLISTPGRVPHSEVKAIYDSMQIMVYPRRSTPATDVVTPLKPFEALATGKAVIVSDVPPLKEIAGENERALVFPTGDARALAEALEQLIDSPERRAQLGETGRDWVTRERDWSTVVRTFTDAYDELRQQPAN